jgi:hypothetical protein
MESREKPNMVPTPKSSNVAAIGYEAPTSTLHVQFRDDKFVYQYHGVPAKTYSAFLAAPSKGQFHANEIKPNFKNYSKYFPTPPRLG